MGDDSENCHHQWCDWVMIMVTFKEDHPFGMKVTIVSVSVSHYK